MDIRGILGIDPEVRNGFNDIKVTLRDRRRRHARRTSRRLVAQSQKRSAVFDIDHQPDQRHGRGQLSPVPRRAGAHHRRSIVGAGHAGLAMSRCLSQRSIDHVVLERGEVANSWRTERWDSLRLLTPNWQSRLPGLAYDGDDPDGFMTMPEVVDFIERYAAVIDAPVRTGTTVTARAAA